jgi:hypothetical protein
MHGLNAFFQGAYSACKKYKYHEFDLDNRWCLDFLELSLLQVVPQLQAFASRGIPLVCVVLAYEMLQVVPQLQAFASRGIPLFFLLLHFRITLFFLLLHFLLCVRTQREIAWSSTSLNSTSLSSGTSSQTYGGLL